MVYCVWRLDYSTDEEDVAKYEPMFTKKLKLVFTILVVLVVVKVLIPTQKEIALIIGGSYVLNNEEISKLPTNTVKAVNTFLEEYTNAIEETGKDGQ